ncbi:acetyl-CoA carboxylase biotin carboxyl carrier protein [Ideonella azotifigens]|uniref:Biotin carboxyl carrier protein of acetyl-CoA carboxylase n=1 Tax=Ideonella azotifigens TaxID=513160 RepID=A0ABP3VW97_9BURK|nr:acetyl-CoA carboxylase biotin carboxyl carrier protein [Ideonella azotifigens]MCD2339561.1 acetyl-CoA carboxylase biotin carboxyl carrier protein [Ideonella azotifigens]
MDLRKLKTLIDLVSESNIAELEITENEGKVRIVKSGGAAFAAPMMPMPMASAPMAPAPALPAADAAPVAPAAATGVAIKSPMVGTFYASSTPGGKPLVEVGSVIKLGQPVCIIEAMKIMNEIEAEITGTVTQVLVQNGQAVEFGQPMFMVE